MAQWTEVEGEVVARTIEERVKAVEDKQDEVIRLFHEFGGELQAMGKDRGLSAERVIARLQTFMVRAGGQLKGIKPREDLD
jgi:D-tyrosyl-tRNA(Tyr) deacylase